MATSTRALLEVEHLRIEFPTRRGTLVAVDDISFDALVHDLETVVDSLGLQDFPLLGVSQGAAIAVAYAARRPGWSRWWSAAPVAGPAIRRWRNGLRRFARG